MTRTVNRKLATVLFAFLILGAGSLHALHELQMKRHGGVWLKQARRAEEQGEFRECLDCMGRYLAENPTDFDTLGDYGVLLDRLAASAKIRERAAAILERALSQRPHRDDVRSRLVDIAMQRGNYTTAQDHLKIRLAATPDAAEIEHRLGQCAEAGSDFDQASTWYHKAIEHRPEQIASYVRLAALLQHRLDDPAQARAVLDRMVDSNEESFQAFLARARYFKQQGMKTQAIEDLQQARRLDATEPEIALASAELAHDLGLTEPTRLHLQKCLRVHPRNPFLYRALAELETKSKRPEQALDCLRRGLQEIPEQPELLQLLCDLLIQRGELDEARRLMDLMTQAELPSARAGYWQARILMQQKRWLEAARLLDKARAALADSPAWATQVLLALGYCYEQIGDPDQQLSTYRRAVADDPGSAAARSGLGRALIAAGQFGEAVAEFRHVVKLPSAPAESCSALAEALFLYNLQLSSEQRDWGEVEQVLARAGQLNGASDRLVLVEANLLAAQKKWTDAQRVIKNAIGQRGPVEFWLALADFADQQGRPDTSLELLDEARQQRGDSVELRVARFRYQAQRAERLRKTVVEIERDLKTLSVEEQARLCLVLAKNCVEVHDVRAAERLVRHAARQQPDDLRSRLLLLDLLLASGRLSALPPLLAEIRRIEGEEGTQWRAGEAARLILLARRGDLTGLRRARELVTELAKQKPTWPRLPALSGHIDELEGKPDRAIANYLQALELGDGRPETAQRLIQLLYERQRYAEADYALRLLQKQAPLRGPLAKLAAEVALATGNQTRARSLANRAVPQTTRDYRDLLWLGQVLEATGQPSNAETTFRAAAERGPSVADTWIALVQNLARTGQKDEAECAIADMKEHVPADQLALALACCYQAIEQPERAEEQFQLALKEQPDHFMVLQRVASYYLARPNQDRAVPYLRRLLTAGVAAPVDLAVWARGELAFVLASSGKSAQFQEALKLLEQDRNGNDRLARARVLALRPEHRAEALHLLEANDGRRLSADEQHLLARLYDASGNSLRARELLLNLLADHGQKPLYLADYIRNLLRTGELSEARRWFLHLERLDPQGTYTRELKTEMTKASQTMLDDK